MSIDREALRILAVSQHITNEQVGAVLRGPAGPLQALLDEYDALVAEHETVKALYAELNGALSWGVTCLNCAKELDASHEGYCRGEQSGLRRYDALVARVTALADEWAAFDCTEDEAPQHIDVPDDYESGLHDAARRLRTLLAEGGPE